MIDVFYPTGAALETTAPRIKLRFRGDYEFRVLMRADTEKMLPGLNFTVVAVTIEDARQLQDFLGKAVEALSKEKDEKKA